VRTCGVVARVANSGDSASSIDSSEITARDHACT
jgi:hypothetical protein